MKVLITGVAGFIGFHVAKKFAENNYHVVGIDNVNDYYSIQLKLDRLRILGVEAKDAVMSDVIQSSVYSNLIFHKIDINSKVEILNIFKINQFDIVIHLAAQAGVRYSLKNPEAYIDTNIHGFFNVIESSKLTNVPLFLYASSSSVYGISDNEVLSTSDKVDNPESIYAATKKTNELFAHVYSSLYGFKTVGMRFFTVYGPYGRPDMAPMIFTNSIIQNIPIDVFNNGNLYRDFTYINDIVESVYRLATVKLLNKYNIFNIGNGSPVHLLSFIKEIEFNIGITAKKNLIGMQMGDVISTHADTTELFDLINYKPIHSFESGIKIFIDWYKKYYQL